MKRLFISLLLILSVMTFAGCSEALDSQETETPNNPNNPGDNGDNSDKVTPGNGKNPYRMVQSLGKYQLSF